MAGHEAIKMNLYKRDFEEERIDVAASLGLDVSSLEVKKMARKRVREHFERDVQTFKVESSGVKEYEVEGLEFSVVNGAVTYLNKDGTPSKFTLNSFHTRHLNDRDANIQNAYSQDSHKVDLLVESVIVSAAKKVEVTKRVDDIKGFRDVYTYRYDPETNKGTLFIRNFEEEGGFESIAEVHNRMRHILPNAIEINPEGNAMVLITTESNIDTRKIQEAYYEQVKQNITFIQAPSLEVRGIDEIRETFHTATQGIMREVNETRVALGEFIDRRMHGAQITESPHYIEEKYTPSPVKRVEDLIIHIDADKRFSVLMESNIQKVSDMSEEHIVSLWQKRAQEIFHISAEQSQEVFLQLQETAAITKNAKEIITLVADPEMQGVGIPAALFAVEMLAHPENFVEVEDLEQDVVVMTSEMWNEVINFLASDLDTHETSLLTFQRGESTQEFEGHSELSAVDVTVLGWLKEFIQTVDDEPAEKQLTLLEHEEEVVLLKMSDALEAFSEFIQQGKAERVIAETRKTSEKIKKEREYVRQFSFVFTLWITLKYHAYYESIRSLKDMVMNKSEYKHLPLLEKIKLFKPDGLVQKELTMLLPAIIYYLNMLREAGVYQATNQKQKKKTKKKSGIIFDFSYSFQAHRDMMKVSI